MVASIPTEKEYQRKRINIHIWRHTGATTVLSRHEKHAILHRNFFISDRYATVHSSGLFSLFTLKHNFPEVGRHGYAKACRPQVPLAVESLQVSNI